MYVYVTQKHSDWMYLSSALSAGGCEQDQGKAISLLHTHVHYIHPSFVKRGVGEKLFGLPLLEAYTLQLGLVPQQHVLDLHK